LPAMRNLQASLERKACEFHDVIKIGRTHLQDAVPMRLGQEFSGYSRQVEAARERVEAALPGIHELAFGGAAVGTGLNALPGFAAAVITEIAQETSIPFREARNHFEAQGARDAVCFLSGALRVYAVSLTKIANDIRWLGCGPRCGIGELRLPAVQPGSSIMPRKVNPVIAESLLMACAQVIGYDATIAWCAAAGNFELNVMMPVIAYDLLRRSSCCATPQEISSSGSWTAWKSIALVPKALWTSRLPWRPRWRRLSAMKRRQNCPMKRGKAVARFGKSRANGAGFSRNSSRPCSTRSSRWGTRIGR